MTPEQANATLSPFLTPTGQWINPNINIAMVKCTLPQCNEVLLQVSDETALPPPAKVVNLRAKEVAVTGQLMAHLQAQHAGDLLASIVCPIQDGLKFETDEFELMPVTEAEEAFSQKVVAVKGIEYVLKKDENGENWKTPKPKALVPLLAAHLAIHEVNKW